MSGFTCCHLDLLSPLISHYSPDRMIILHVLFITSSSVYFFLSSTSHSVWFPITIISHMPQQDGTLRPQCRHLANWTKHTRRLWFWPIRFIVWKHDVIHKTRNKQLPSAAVTRTYRIPINYPPIIQKEHQLHYLPICPALLVSCVHSENTCDISASLRCDRQMSTFTQ